MASPRRGTTTRNLKKRLSVVLNGIVLTVNFVAAVCVVASTLRASVFSSHPLSYQYERLTTATVPAENAVRDQNPTSTAGLDLPSLTELLNASGSDKYYAHHYERYYSKWLQDYRQKPGLKMLEIGAEKGRSLQLWQDYFTDPEAIVGLSWGSDRDRVMEVASNMSAVTILQGDQSKPATMRILVKRGPWDVIIDDGSHVPKHMVYSLFALWNAVQQGGLYIIEDLETNYWPDGDRIYGYRLTGTGIGAGPTGSAVAKLKQLIDVLNRYQIGAPELSVMSGDGGLCSMEWGMNIVALKKCTAEQAASNPPFKPARFNGTEMAAWIQASKATNPAIGAKKA